MTIRQPYYRHDPYSSDLIADDKIKEEEEMEGKEMVVAPIVTPAVSAEEALAAWKRYEDLKSSIVTANDKQDIQGKTYLKKSYWRKIATFFNLSCECMTDERQDRLDFFTYEITYKATAPNGRFSYGDGACSSNEKGLEKTEHNTRAIAHTRAYNRAVSNLVGGGEVSYEEVVASTAPPEALKDKPKKISKPRGDLTEVLQFGKYKGKSLEEIYKENSQYFEWLLDQKWFNETNFDDLRDKVQIFLDNKRFEDLP